MFIEALAVLELQPNFIESSDKNLFFFFMTTLYQFIFVFLCACPNKQLLQYDDFDNLGHTAIEADASLMVVQSSAYEMSYNFVYSLKFINELKEINHRITCRFFHKIIDFYLS